EHSKYLASWHVEIHFANYQSCFHLRNPPEFVVKLKTNSLHSIILHPLSNIYFIISFVNVAAFFVFISAKIFPRASGGNDVRIATASLFFISAIMGAAFSASIFR